MPYLKELFIGDGTIWAKNCVNCIEITKDNEILQYSNRKKERDAKMNETGGVRSGKSSYSLATQSAREIFEVLIPQAMHWQLAWLNMNSVGVSLPCWKVRFLRRAPESKNRKLRQVNPASPPIAALCDG